MTMRTMVLVAALLSVGSMLHAQEPVVGVKDPESLFKDPDPMLNRNKQATLHIMRELLQCGQWDRAGEWLTQAYHQHNPNAASGLDGVVAFFTKVMKVKRLDKCDKLTTEVVAVIADDDYVTVLMPRKYPDPRIRQGVLHDLVRYLAVRQRQGRRALGSGYNCRTCSTLRQGDDHHGSWSKESLDTGRARGRPRDRRGLDGRCADSPRGVDD